MGMACSACAAQANLLFKVPRTRMLMLWHQARPDNVLKSLHVHFCMTLLCRHQAQAMDGAARELCHLPGHQALPQVSGCTTHEEVPAVQGAPGVMQAGLQQRHLRARRCWGDLQVPDLPEGAPGMMQASLGTPDSRAGPCGGLWQRCLHAERPCGSLVPTLSDDILGWCTEAPRLQVHAQGRGFGRRGRHG